MRWGGPGALGSRLRGIADNPLVTSRLTGGIPINRRDAQHRSSVEPSAAVCIGMARPILSSRAVTLGFA